MQRIYWAQRSRFILGLETVPVYNGSLVLHRKNWPPYPKICNLLPHRKTLGRITLDMGLLPSGPGANMSAGPPKKSKKDNCVHGHLKNVAALILSCSGWSPQANFRKIDSSLMSIDAHSHIISISASKQKALGYTPPGHWNTILGMQYSQYFA